MNTKTQKLVTAGYALAKGLDAESAKLVKELATELAVQRVRADELNKQVVNLAVENSSLLPKAASELLNAWMLHKYWVGIQVALMHVNAGRLHDGMTWLQNTVSGPGIEAPELSDFAEIEAWANEQQKDSIGHVRALEIIKAASPATDAALASIQAKYRAEGINFSAGRLCAAYNHGFIDKPMKEVADVVRMILDAKEELSGGTLLASDGLSGEYAEKSLEEYAEQLGKGAAV
ncbi:hypothetical protein EDF88_4158 [Buttiauxella sp. BIGb0552]|uniref:hypothetical protein n=1 Tax=Buttiauxella sp. BIGb0552 TaxID=2485120 RepID=UPI001065FC07|nr:hypothetical protein [Buttiauxella sp. BIGb0552]TDX14832.1 hypothetical protein EDF88_4158 [Buttiauxella sp. BIGb0552]